MQRILIVGGNAGGMTAAGRAARLDPDLRITVLEQGEHVSYSICGAPYYISGSVKDAAALVSYTPAEFQQRHGVRVHTGVRACSVEPARKRVVAEDLGSCSERAFEYDRLLLATGYRPERLDCPGSGLDHVFTLSSLHDAQRIAGALASHPKAALLVGGGLVNVELAESLRACGLTVRLLEKSGQILPGLDPQMADLVEQRMAAHGVEIVKGRTVRTLFGGADGRVESAAVEGFSERVPADMVIVDIGVRPEVSLAEKAGLALGRSGAIEVTPRLETSLAGVYAAGNCAEAVHMVSNRAVFSALGTVANKQGRVAGENLAGRTSVFRGVLNTWVVRAFDLCVARTGLSHREALECAFRPVAVQVVAPSNARYFPGSQDLTLRAIADRDSRRLLGLQAAGAGADKRVDVAAAVLTSGLRVDEAAQLDLSYSPPYSQVWDPFLIAMNALLRAL